MLVPECTGAIVPRGCNDRSYRDRDQHSVMTAAEKEKDMEDKRTYKEAFDDFDWNKNGTIPTKDLQYALRRAGQNPTDVEVQDLINEIDDGTGTLDFNDFCLVIKDTFRAFSKDDEGCIPADEMKYVLMHLPGKITYKEIDEMIHTVDKNGDGKISYSEFRVMMGGIPLLVQE